MARKKYQHYTDEFRREAVRRADQPGHTASSVAKELGIHPGQIYNWRRQFTRFARSHAPAWERLRNCVKARTIPVQLRGCREWTALDCTANEVGSHAGAWEPVGKNHFFM